MRRFASVALALKKPSIAYLNSFWTVDFPIPESHNESEAAFIDSFNAVIRTDFSSLTTLTQSDEMPSFGLFALSVAFFFEHISIDTTLKYEFMLLFHVLFSTFRTAKAIAEKTSLHSILLRRFAVSPCSCVVTSS